MHAQHARTQTAHCSEYGHMPHIHASMCAHACRDPKHFQLLLNWLRDGWCALPASPEALMELMVELRAYNVRQVCWVALDMLA